MFLGFPGFGFTMNFGNGGGNGRQRFGVNQISFGICIVMVFLSFVGEFFSVFSQNIQLEGPRYRYNSDSYSRKASHQSSYNSRHTARPRNNRTVVDDDSDYMSYIFSGLYTLFVIMFIVYAILQRNRNVHPTAA